MIAQIDQAGRTKASVLNNFGRIEATFD